MKKLIFLSLCFSLFCLNYSCEDLEDKNQKEPSFQKIINPSQVNDSISSLLNSWLVAGNYDSDGGSNQIRAFFEMYLLSDVGSNSWGGFFVNISSEPRGELTNSESNPEFTFFELCYLHLYELTNSASDLLLAISKDGGSVVEEPIRAKACAKIVQASALGVTGLMFNKAFVVTEHTDNEDKMNLVSYEVMIDSAINIIDEVIALCESSAFTLPESWMPSTISFTNVELGQLANTIAARLLAYKSRNATQNAANDWQKIKAYAEKGLSFDFELVMDDNKWTDYVKWYATGPGWGRVDMRVINMLDPNMPPWFPASGEIEDLPNNGLATSNDMRLLSDFEYIPDQNFRKTRGVFHFSTYRYKRFDDYLETWAGSIAVIRKAECDMLHAEALVRTGDLQGAASILNNPLNSRKTRGGLGDVKVEEQKLLDAIFYEKQIECILTGKCVEFYDMRRNDLLQAGTFLHLPIPAGQLKIMKMEPYSLGGTSGVPGEDYSTGGWETKTKFKRPSY